ncbi:MAG: hypothetical protein K2Y71_09115 [Xanthobacteraceae bacterium]|nr:hypothetical protein [Xanthobacteraceae bacterium]
MTISQADLPPGWEALGPEGGFEGELKLELGPVHRLYGVPLQGVARRSSNDDVLFRHTAEADLYSVVHLTWSGAEEPPGWPAVEFTGTFAQFCKRYEVVEEDC